MKKTLTERFPYELALCVLIITGCVKDRNRISTGSAQVGSDFQIIVVDKISEKQNIDSIVQSYYYLPLQTDESCLIGKVDKIMFHNKKVYILDSQTKSIFAFEMNGKFAFKINKIGRGSGEYDNIRDFDIDFSNNQLIILCTNFRKLIFYDTENGQFLREELLDFRPLSFMSAGQKSYLFDARFKLEENMSDNTLVILNHSDNTSTGYLTRNNYPSTERTPFSRYNEVIYYSSNYNDTVFAFRDGLLLKRYFIDFGSRKLNMNSLPEELFSDSGVLGVEIVPFLSHDKFAKYMQNTNTAYHITSFMESDNFIKFHFIYGKRIYNALYDKTTQHVKTYSELQQTNDILYSSITYSVFNNSFVGIINADILQKILVYHKKKDSLGLNTLKMRVNLPDTITSTDNPLLVFINFKTF